MRFDNFFRAYIECALWSSVDENDEPMEVYYLPLDIEEQTYCSLMAEAQDFWDTNYDLLFQHGTDEQCGHDFWLTRNGHGSGFWDRGTGEVGELLTKAAKIYGGKILYEGDDGRIYAM